MIRKLFLVLTLVVFAGGLSSCYVSPVIPPAGAVYTNVKAPQNPEAAGKIGSKVGKSDASSILGLISFGDASVKAAADNGGISEVQHTDYEFFNLLGIYQRYSTIAYGD